MLVRDLKNYIDLQRLHRVSGFPKQNFSFFSLPDLEGRKISLLGDGF